jgi:hypothetical protein
MLTPEQITENYEEYVSLLKKTGDHRQQQIDNLLSCFEERLALCPASHCIENHGCFPGGLVQHSLRVLKMCNRLAQASGFKLDKQSMIFACLFHDLGKVGDTQEDHYITQTNDWWRQKGNLYEINPKLQWMNHEHRSIYNLQHFNVPMTSDEFLAIMLHNGLIKDANKEYMFKEPILAILVHQADLLAVRSEKSERNNA